MLPTGRDLSDQHDRISFRVRATTKERLDTYLLRRLGWSSRQKVQRLIDKGRVRVDGKLPKAGSRIRPGFEIEVFLDPGGSTDLGHIPPPFWEDPYLLGIDKPPGILVHPVGRTVRGTVINELHARYKVTRHVGQREVVPKLCHRLDRETSGMLLIAKTDDARRALQESFESDRVRKGYWAVVQGAPPRVEFEVDLPVAAHLDREREDNNRLARVHEEGKPSLTAFTLLAKGANYSILECRPKTGRQNQIRAHLAAVGLPILGDTGFGSQRQDWKHASLEFPPRTLLHSYRLRFPHPVWGIEYSLQTPPPLDMVPFFGDASPL